VMSYHATDGESSQAVKLWHVRQRFRATVGIQFRRSYAADSAGAASTRSCFDTSCIVLAHS
jgi:hypothetical protein